MVSTSASISSQIRRFVFPFLLAAMLGLGLLRQGQADEGKEYAINPVHEETIAEDVMNLAREDPAIREENLAPHGVEEWDKPLPSARAQLDASNATTKTIAIGDAVRIALENNPAITSAIHRKRAATYGKYSRIGAMLPSVTGGYSYSYSEAPRAKGSPPSSANRNYTLFFNIQQDLFVGFRNISNLVRAKFAEEQAKLNRYNEELSLLLDVQENFLNLLRAREDVRSAQDSVTRLESQLKVTRAFYDVGLSPRLDVLQAEVDLAEAEDTLLQAENNVAVQLARLNTLLPLNLGDDVQYVGELKYEPFPLSLETCLERAYRNRPDLLIFKKAVDIARQDSRVAASALYPQIQGEFNWSQFGDTPALQGSPYTDLNRYDQWSLEIGLTWELFDFGENLFTWRQARESEKEAQADVAGQYLEATYDVKSRRLQIDETAKRIAVAQKRVEQGKEGYRMAVARYQAQVGTNNDVLDAQSRLTSAESTLTEALVDYQIAVANLYVAIGAKNVDLEFVEE
ncbi:TolC family protein [Oceanidesulfovibrio indonesiensis]|nr:TolC family protein [Oceanidesulfovibrio indonesiensis]